MDHADESVIGNMLDAWLGARLMVHLDGRYLSLALQAASSVEQTAGLPIPVRQFGGC